MKDIIESLVAKVSSYNIFNYLFPGAVFIVGFEFVTGQPFLHLNLIGFLLVAYFIGMALSRVGSLIIEPFLRWIKFVRFCDYNDFVAAEKTDSKLTTLSQENNTFRTLIAVFVGLLVAKTTTLIQEKYPASRSLTEWGVLVSVLFLFVFAYRKQTGYIVKRVARAKK